MALCITACEGIWLRRLLDDQRVVVEGAVTHFEDNQSCIKVVNDPMDGRHLKHVDITYKFIRELIQEGRIQVSYIPTDWQLGDLMTKGLPTGTFVRLREAIGLQKLSRGVDEQYLHYAHCSTSFMSADAFIVRWGFNIMNVKCVAFLFRFLSFFYFSIVTNSVHYLNTRVLAYHRKSQFTLLLFVR